MSVLDMMSREEALYLVKKHVSKRNWIYHMLAVEAKRARALASHFGEDEKEWGLLGLLHDIDFEKTEKRAERHALEAEDMLRGRVSETLMRGLKAHNYEHTKVKPESRMEKSLIATDAVSGLLIASALVMPSKKMSEVTVKTLEKKYKQKDFARGASRDRIGLHEEIGLSRKKFFEIALESLKGINETIGL